MKKYLISALVVAGLTFTGAASAKKLKFQMSSKAGDWAHTYMAKHAPVLSDLTNGELQIEGLPTKSVVPHRETIDAVANGILDGDETDIDCGGSCATCPDPVVIELDGSEVWESYINVFDLADGYQFGFAPSGPESLKTEVVPDGVNFFPNFDVWDENDGGIFLYKENNEIKGILPEYNKIIVNNKFLEHSVSMIVPTAEHPRVTMQIFENDKR